MLNIGSEDGFSSMPKHTFFNLVNQFDIPVEIQTLLEERMEVNEKLRGDALDKLLGQMRQFRLSKLRPKVGKSVKPKASRQRKRQELSLAKRDMEAHDAAATGNSIVHQSIASVEMHLNEGRFGENKGQKRSVKITKVAQK